jgi:hypothetical protein
MVGTVSAARQRGRAGAAFAAGLALGSAAVFTALAAVGAVVGGRLVLVVAVAIGAAAVVSDALGLRVRPQIHLQVPEPWRRTMPLGRALFLYGLLLGTGLTTYVPATAAWALPVLCLALGSLGAALAIAAGFACRDGVCPCWCSRRAGARRCSRSGRTACASCACWRRPRCCARSSRGGSKQP